MTTIIRRRAYTSSSPEKPWEEEGTLWVWAWPELLGWPRQIRWLFSPVVGRAVYPGDLVGIDETGRLILVETKRGMSPGDPFEDYLGKASQLRSLSKKALIDRWEHLLAAEGRFVRDYLDRLEILAATRTKCPGIVPYSCQRYVVARWEALYRERILPLLSAESHYEADVRSYLERREESEPKALSFVGLFTACEGKTPKLSGKGRRAMEELVAEVGASNVHLRTVRAVREADEVVIYGEPLAVDEAGRTGSGAPGERVAVPGDLQGQ